MTLLAVLDSMVQVVVNLVHVRMGHYAIISLESVSVCQVGAVGTAPLSVRYVLNTAEKTKFFSPYQSYTCMPNNLIL